VKSPIVLRADFRQPKGALNPLDVKMAGTIPVELYQARSTSPQEWRAHRPGTKTDFRIGSQQSAKVLQSQIELHFFEERLTEWIAFDTTWNPPVQLERSEWTYTMEDGLKLTEHGAELHKERLSKLPGPVAVASEKVIPFKTAK
jgi:hypothetical protein